MIARPETAGLRRAAVKDSVVPGTGGESGDAAMEHPSVVAAGRKLAEQSEYVCLPGNRGLAPRGYEGFCSAGWTRWGNSCIAVSKTIAGVTRVMQR